MQGEQLEIATVGPGGIEGDRRWAVVDADTGVSLSAKRYADLLRCRAWTTSRGVMICLPDGREYLTDSPEVAQALSDLLQRAVTTRNSDAVKKIQHEFPKAVTEGAGEPFLFAPDTEAFFDSAPLQLLTSATLIELQKLLPASAIHQTRFRPNFLVAAHDRGFIENDWVDKAVTLGSLKCEVFDNTRRCIMVALGQGKLPRDVDIIRTILKRNEGRAGVALRTTESGVVQRGAKVSLLS
ncbi:MAG: MOSC domain-containing protein [Gammaproteobacteria bacterium]|nr:MOSC domain-containing protein [Gammaproteobacteria bacterium]